jgi:hypothetical protein
VLIHCSVCRLKLSRLFICVRYTFISIYIYIPFGFQMFIKSENLKKIQGYPVVLRNVTTKFDWYVYFEWWSLICHTFNKRTWNFKFLLLSKCCMCFFSKTAFRLFVWLILFSYDKMFCTENRTMTVFCVIFLFFIFKTLFFNL